MRRYHLTDKQRQPISRHRAASLLLGVALAAGACTAHAQLSGSVAALSDYRFRGRSLSDGHPTAQLTLNYDGSDGWYAGAMAAHTTLDDTGSAQLVAYGGYAQRLPGGMGWEAGATQAVFTRASAYNYAEGYIGVSGAQASARLYYSPRYFGRATRSIYADVNGFLRITHMLRLTGHAGLLRIFEREGSLGSPSSHRYDFRLGLAARIGNVDVQFARATRAAARNPAYAAPQPHAFVLSAAYSF